MFFKLAYQNARRSRQENLIYFFTLVVAAASFYIILALEKQDVITYLRTFESSAVERFFALMPLLYAVALLLISFLVLFANRYQLDRRSREFGLYMVLGMRRRKLFLQLMTEGAITSGFALIGGIIVGAIMSELISLVTSRLVGQGIISHQLSFSLAAVGWTALAFLFIQCFVLLLLGTRMFKRELHELLYGRTDKKQAKGSAKGNIATLLIGIVLLAASHIIALKYFTILQDELSLLATLAAAVFLCCVGTLLVVRGSARIIGLAAGSSRSRQTRGLRTFTLRQFQEFIANKPMSVTASSLLVFFAIIFLASGASMILSSSSREQTSVYDFTVIGEEKEVQSALSSAELSPYVANLNRLEIGHMAYTLDSDNQPVVDMDWSKLRKRIVASLPAGVADPGVQKNGYSIDTNDPWALNLLKELDSHMVTPEIIPESSYNRLLAAAGLEQMKLADDELTFYLSPKFSLLTRAEDISAFDLLLRDANSDKDSPLRIGGHPLHLTELPPMKNLVTDRSITLAFALIVPDALFKEQLDPSNSTVFWNFCIPQSLKDEQGLLAPIRAASDLLASSDLEYESYLQNFGRQLFYVVAGSYTLLYLGFIFLLIGCSVLALQFLTQMQQAKSRYLTLSMLGAKRTQLRRSLYSQVAAYFLLPLTLAIINGIAGIWTILGTFMFINGGADGGLIGGDPNIYYFAFAIAGVVILIELFYALAVVRAADHALDKFLLKERTVA